MLFQPVEDGQVGLVSDLKGGVVCTAGVLPLGMRKLRHEGLRDDRPSRITVMPRGPTVMSIERMYSQEMCTVPTCDHRISRSALRQGVRA